MLLSLIVHTFYGIIICVCIDIGLGYSIVKNNSNFGLDVNFPCGVRAEPIRGILFGTIIHAEKSPWQVIVLITTEEITNSCGGVIVSSLHVLTAAHCLKANATYGVTAGGEIKSNQQARDAKKVIRHPYYHVNGVVENDLAVIFLQSKLTYTRTVRPLCLSDQEVSNLNTKEAKVTGYGLTESGQRSTSLVEANMVIAAGYTCFRHWGKRQATFCAWPVDNGTVCYGDSGGPLALPGVLRWRLLGLTSFGAIVSSKLTCMTNTTVAFTDLTNLGIQVWLEVILTGRSSGDLRNSRETTTGQASKRPIPTIKPRYQTTTTYNQYSPNNALLQFQNDLLFLFVLTCLT